MFSKAAFTSLMSLNSVVTHRAKIGRNYNLHCIPHISDGQSYQRTHEKHLEVEASHLQVQNYEGGNKSNIMDHILSLQKMS